MSDAVLPYRKLDEYSKGLERIKLEREDGILTVRFHKDDGEFSWNLRTHREVSMLWNDIGMDPENKIIILTGTGEGFLRLADYGDGFGSVTPQWLTLAHQEGKKFMMDFLEIEQPIITALNGPVAIHSQIPMLSDIVLATPDTMIEETHMYPAGVLPGDGHHVVWPLVLGFNRARAMLLTGQGLTAQEAKELGVVFEIVERQDLLPRAKALARDLLKLPPVTLRYFRPMMMQHAKRLMLDQLSQGMVMEGMSILDGGFN